MINDDTEKTSLTPAHVICNNAVSPNPLHSIDMRRSMVVILVTVYPSNRNTEMRNITYPVVMLCYYRREIVMGSESQVPTQPGRFHKKSSTTF